MPIVIHPQNQVPQRVFDDLGPIIRDLDGPDLDLVARAVDQDEDPPVGYGEDLFEALVLLTERYRGVSAAFFIAQAIHCLGWPVTT
jgi:hypothetical protein